MRNQFGILEVFNYVDGRLATSMDNVYDVAIAYTNDEGVSTTGLILVAEKIRKDRPQWFIDAEEIINTVKEKIGNNFDLLTFYLKENYSDLVFTID